MLPFALQGNLDMGEEEVVQILLKLQDTQISHRSPPPQPQPPASAAASAAGGAAAAAGAPRRAGAAGSPAGEGPAAAAEGEYAANGAHPQAGDGGEPGEAAVNGRRYGTRMAAGGCASVLGPALHCVYGVLYRADGVSTSCLLSAVPTNLLLFVHLLCPTGI